MSFDLLLQNGDITISQTADFAIVVDRQKLIQDIIKMITTPIGSNVFQPSIGSLINKRLIGQTLGAANVVTILQGSIQEALGNLQKLQKVQAQSQALSPSETLITINSVSVARDSIEPRQLNVILKVVSGDGNTISETLTMSL